MLCRADDLSQVEVKDILIKADGFEISEKSTEIHGITKERSLVEGVDLREAIQNEIFPIFAKAQFVVAHNADFDTNVFMSELCRGEHSEFLDHFEGMEVICTMKKTKTLVQARGQSNRLKNPSLKEMYEFATSREMEGHHNAMYDVVNMHAAVKVLVDDNRLKLF